MKHHHRYNMKYTRTVPYLKLLTTTPPSKRKHILNVFPRFAVDDMSEVLYNIVRGNTHITPKEKKLLFRHKTKLLKLVRAKNKSQRRHIIQSGGLAPFVAPLIASAVSSIAPPLFQRFFNWLFGWWDNRKKKKEEQKLLKDKKPDDKKPDDDKK